jgi:hypothetical protein
VKHAIGVFIFIFPIYFLFFISSGQIANGGLPIIFKPDKSVVEYIIDEYEQTQKNSQLPIGIDKIYIKIILRSKR